ncbi:1,4-alpha-glucan branching protein domain-containing protein [Alicyclobacillus dauci]|uniref:DUF1957 domain-containing protein n=1 Tax=Alicyclobacillus dauci TaxID=1475485 RepID=A0ABY6Z445_9BACL|nr:1,4-alpha-glucan branching protein domain-containing protein [Alicyclobacillus dauci]WAH37658.1 DUF1957 domain-containing protein [Alicyclobacillus dauci]
MPKGYLNLVLHAHLPFVRHVDRADRLEERWLFEAITETYIPLLQCMHRLLEDGVDFGMTVSLSPTLISMLADPLLQSRYEKHIDNLIRLADSEIVRTRTDGAMNQLARTYRERFQEIRAFYHIYKGNLLRAFGELQQAGKVELITSAATHAFLPYVRTDEALRVQIATAVDVFRAHFGDGPQGIWLPECAYTSRVDRFLGEFGIRYFFVDTHGLTTASPEPVFGTFAPVLTPRGIAAFARDEESSRQVWSSEHGYPGDFDYREYYRDIGYDLDTSYIAPYIHPDGIRVNTGMKYYKITGHDHHKELYNFDHAREKAAIHAGNFLFNRGQQVEFVQGKMGRKPIITAPYDAELFGHWWFEGPIFIDILFRKMHYDQSTVKAITPSEYLDLYEDFQECELSMSTWGRDGFGDVWLNGSNDWIYPALHDCETRMVRLAGRIDHPGDIQRRALNQAARELMLAESSDWAFIMDSKTTVDYAVRRTKHHVNRFRALAKMIEDDQIDERYLVELEGMDNLFPHMRYEIYRNPRHHVRSRKNWGDGQRPLRVLMLSWEFPPMTVGGLARHVYDLSRHLVARGCEVHVVTTAIGDYPLDELVEGVHVHRVQVLQPDGGEFVHFAFQLNLMMLDRCRKLIGDEGYKFDLIHAHDWLVCQVATTLKKTYNIPLISTVHATEHGRNAGIHTDVQRHIHHLEWQLTYESRRVIVCSTYMQREIERIFSLPWDKIDVLPNGVDRKLLQPPDLDGVLSKEPYARQDEPMVVFIGRLVQEKGVQFLLSAVPSVLCEFPRARFVILGKGPYQGELMAQSARLGISDHVTFTGFAPDDTRNRILCAADVAVFPSVYEPFGIVALEAMAAGTSVVVADVGGLSDIVQHDHNGLKVYPHDPESLAEQLKRLLRDKEFAKRLSAAAEEELVRFDWMQIAGNTIRLYEKIVGSTHGLSAEERPLQTPVVNV